MRITETDIPAIRRRRAALFALRSGLARELRIAEGFSQVYVARSLNVSPAAVCRWESGSRSPTGERGLAYIDYVADLIGEAAR